MKRFRLTSMQEVMLYETLRDPSRYITTLCYKLSVSMDEQMLSQRLARLVLRHEALRTAFVRDEEGVFWGEVTERVNNTLFKLTIQGDELTVTFHHALLDGWSVGILLRELLMEEEPGGKASPFRYYIKWLENKDFTSALGWWEEYLGDTRVCSELPNVRTTDEYERHELRFAIEDTACLKNVARELKMTEGKLLEAMWCMLVARYNSGESLVCVVNTGRSAPVPGLTGMVGMCVNTLPILTKLPKPPESLSFADWVRQWSRQLAEAEKHGFCSLGDLINGDIPHILSIDPSPDDKSYTLKSSNARLVTDFDVAFTLGDAIKAEFAYNAYAYTQEAVKAIQGHFVTALHAVLANPSLAVERIPILTGAELSKLTARNESKAILDVIKSRTVADFWRESAELYRNREALVFGKNRLTYADVSQQVDRLSAALKARGVSAEARVAIQLSHSERYVIAELAVILAGGLFIPLDMQWPKARLQTILAETKPLLVIDEAIYDELLSNESTMQIGPSAHPDDAAYMIMTSGTTGVPKGVVVEHRSLANFCLWAKERYGWKAGDACALELGFSFDGSFWSIWLPLISGGTLHVLCDETRFDLVALGRYCREEHITHIDLPVTMASAFREIYRGEKALPDLRVMITGGEEVRGIIDAPYRLSNEYGPTECTVCCSVGWICEEDSPVTVGSPPPNMAAYIVDEWQRLCPDGVMGQAVFSGVQLARGYDQAPDLSAERFVPNPFAGDDLLYQRMYYTGDLMKWISRNNCRELVFMGRADSQVKINGFRIELSEIEAALRGHVVASAVTVLRRGSGEKQLVAYVVPKETVTVAGLEEVLASKLPSFMRPTIIKARDIPLKASGKVDFEQLALLETEKSVEAVAPTTESERLLQSAVSRILGMTSVGMNHDYLALGGNSINAMRIVFALESSGFSLSAKELITSTSLKEAAAKMVSVTTGDQNGYDNGMEGNAQKTFVPLPAQQAFVFLAETVSPAMYTVTLRRKAAGLDLKTFQKRLDKAAALHDILRTSFAYNQEGQIVGQVDDVHKIQILTGYFDAHDYIDPMNGPLLDIRCADDMLIIRYHHIALDGWSVNMLINELLYDQFPEKAPSFAAFANRLTVDEERRALDEQWWRESSQKAEVVSFFTPRPKGQVAAYRRIEVCPPELLSRCANAARMAGTTPAVFALAAWGLVLHIFAAAEGDILIPFVASCRDDEFLMGMCAETRPLVFTAKGGSFGALARHTQEAMLASIAHWLVPQDIIAGLPGYLFVFDDTPDSYVAEGEQNYDMIVKFSDHGEMIYNAACLADRKAEKLAACLHAALAAAVEDRISVLNNEERELVTKIFACGRLLQIAHKNLSAALRVVAGSYGGSVALETETEHFTYAELFERAQKLADDLNAEGIGAGYIVAFSLERNAEGIIAQIGIALSGAAFLPLDPAWPETRKCEILQDAGAAAVIEAGLKIKNRAKAGEMIGGMKASVIPTDSAYVIYTSGTAGKPKGVIMTQEALINQMTWAVDEFKFNTQDKMLHYIAFTFDPSVWVLFTALAAGASLSLLPESVRLDPFAVACHIEEHEITRCTLPAAVGADILRHVKESRLKTVFLGGEVIKNLPSGQRSYEIINCYGPTETCINAAFCRLPPDRIETNCIGHPVANTSLLVLDGNGEPCPVDLQGELYIGGVQLAHSYLNRPQETKAAFAVHKRFGRLYRTGDRVAWNEDGTLVFLGRRDNQVKIRGNRVELLEIEQTLCGLCGIRDAKVRLSDGALDAYIIREQKTSQLDIFRIRQELSERLPSYMLPRSITPLKAFPLTQNGKVDINALPVVCRPDSEDAEPLSEMEEKIAKAWRKVLGLAPDFVIRHNDNFYALGGHSLLLFHVVGLLAASGISVEIKTLIGHPVLAELKEAICKRESGVPPALSAAPEAPPEPSDALVTSTKAYEQYIKRIKTIDLTEKRLFRNVLITGGTGFLGSHLVRECYSSTGAVIHLPVRGDEKKVWETLAYYFNGLADEMAASGRIRIYVADLSENVPEVDTSIPLDAIFHTAADIRHYAPEEEMFRANVIATENMLALAERHPGVLFAHISTTSAVNALVIHETDTAGGAAFTNIYQRTKQLAERRVLDAGKRGLTYALFRVGHVSPGFESGTMAKNRKMNAMMRLQNAMMLTGLLPEQDYQIAYGFVDKSAEAIRLLSSPVHLENMIFHIENPNSLPLSQLFGMAGLRVQVLSKKELISQLEVLAGAEDQAVRSAAAEYLGRLAQSLLEKESAEIVQGELRMDATLLMLKRLDFEWPRVTAGYMQKIIQNLKGGGMV